MSEDDANEYQRATLIARKLGVEYTEARLLLRIHAGEQNHRIARHLGVVAGTIKSRLFRVYQRIGVKSRTQAAVKVHDILTEDRIRALEAEIADLRSVRDVL